MRGTRISWSGKAAAGSERGELAEPVFPGFGDALRQGFRRQGEQVLGVFVGRRPDDGDASSRQRQLSRSA
jgi:hypothetical protein